MITLRLSKEIYSEKSVACAVSAYGKLANMEISEEIDAWTITFSGCKYEENRTAKEFENYLIGAENMKWS